MFDEEDLASIREERERWEAKTLEPYLEHGERKESFVTVSNDENVMPPIIDAVKVYVTMGEIMGVFEDHYGSYQETVGLA